MSEHFLTINEGSIPGSENDLCGEFQFHEAYPLLAESSDSNYTLLHCGNLASLFSAPSFEKIDLCKILSRLPESSGLQAYCHHFPLELGTGDCPSESLFGPSSDTNKVSERKYLALSSRVPYTRPFMPQRGFTNLFKKRFLLHELEKLHALTEKTYDNLVLSLEGQSGLQHLKSADPILRALGPLRIKPDGAIEVSDSVVFNLSYLILGPARFAVALELSTLPNSGDYPLPLPPYAQEYIRVTCIHKPKMESMAEQNEETENFLRFLDGFMQREGNGGKEPHGEKDGFPKTDSASFESEIPLSSHRQKIFLRHSLMLFGNSPLSLVQSADGYLQSLLQAGISFHASMLGTKETYASLFPGNFPSPQSGISVPLQSLSKTLKRLCP